MRKALQQYNESEYKNLTVGSSGVWKFVSRVTNSTSVCLISRIRKDGKNCRAELATNASSNKSILSHAKSFHNVDLKELLEQELNERNAKMTKYMTELKLNDIWNPESAISRLVAKEGATLNFFQDNLVMEKLFKIAFNESIPNKQALRKKVLAHAKSIKGIIKNKLKDINEISVSFDEWTSRSNIQIINLIAHTDTTDFNLGLVEINTETASAENLNMLISRKLEEFDILPNVKVLTADGAATNPKIAR